MPAPVVLFDVDGTLTDTNYLHTLAWRRAFLESVGASPADGLVIGDTGWDLDAASAAGLPAIAVCSGGWTAQELLAGGAVEVHDDVSVLLGSIETSALGDHLRSD